MHASTNLLLFFFFLISVLVYHYLDKKDTLFKQQQPIYLRPILH